MKLTQLGKDIQQKNHTPRKQITSDNIDAYYKKLAEYQKMKHAELERLWGKYYYPSTPLENIRFFYLNTPEILIDMILEVECGIEVCMYVYKQEAKNA